MLRVNGCTSLHPRVGPGRLHTLARTMTARDRLQRTGIRRIRRTGPLPSDHRGADGARDGGEADPVARHSPAWSEVVVAPTATSAQPV